MPAVEARSAVGEQPPARVHGREPQRGVAVRPYARHADPLLAGPVEHQGRGTAAEEPGAGQHAAAEFRAALLTRLRDVRELRPDSALRIENPAVGPSEVVV